jgi:hypothetical protein
LPARPSGARDARSGGGVLDVVDLGARRLGDGGGGESQRGADLVDDELVAADGLALVVAAGGGEAALGQAAGDEDPVAGLEAGGDVFGGGPEDAAGQVAGLAVLEAAVPVGRRGVTARRMLARSPLITTDEQMADDPPFETVDADPEFELCTLAVRRELSLWGPLLRWDTRRRLRSQDAAREAQLDRRAKLASRHIKSA